MAYPGGCDPLPCRGLCTLNILGRFGGKTDPPEPLWRAVNYAGVAPL